MLRGALRYTAVALILALVLACSAYLWDINRAYERVSGNSTVISSPYGDIEFTEGGSGPDVLVVHGSGGGYDQGELLVQAGLGSQFHWVAPSRFGYLQSTFHENATFDDQAMPMLTCSIIWESKRLLSSHYLMADLPLSSLQYCILNEYHR